VLTTTVIVGAGHAGLAMSRRLTERSIEHVVIERGEVGDSWRTQRWPTLRLLTPNWQTRLPGLSYRPADPDGYMRAYEVVELLSGYAEAIAAPVRSNTRVMALRTRRSMYEVVTDHGTWTAPSVVIATGASNLPAIPPIADAVPPSLTSISPLGYRGPEELPDGGVLVVGASATGVQLADEIARSGRPVTLAIGEHVRLPRLYRGRDIFWWMDTAGVLDQRYDQIDDLVRARHVPSPQLIGTPERRTIDLNAMTSIGVRIVGKLGRVTGYVAQFSGGLANICALADLKMGRLLDSFDQWALQHGTDDVEPPHRFESTRVNSRPALDLDLSSGEIRTIVWATGYRPDYSWIDIPVVGRSGQINHHGGVVPDAPGIYVLGTPFLRRRRSSFIHGAERDTEELAEHLHGFLSRSRRTWLLNGSRDTSDPQTMSATRPSECSSPSPRNNAGPPDLQLLVDEQGRVEGNSIPVLCDYIGGETLMRYKTCGRSG
jgi:putative flavoprotein involved in K+ transport